MALKDLIATPGECIASLIGKEWRISDSEVLMRIRDLADEAVAAEREACAKIAEDGVDTPHPTVAGVTMKAFGKAPTIAAAIRARK